MNHLHRAAPALAPTASSLGRLDFLFLLLLMSACLPCLGGLVGHWKFDEASGSIAHDVTGQRDGNLSATGAGFAAGGISGNAVKLDRAENGFVQIQAPAGLVATNFSVVVWARLPPGDLTTETYPVTLHEAWQPNGFFIHLNQAGASGQPAKASFWAGGNSQVGSSTTSINDGAWHQIALVYAAAGQTALYVDGAPAEVSIPSSPLSDRDPPLLVGGVYGHEVAGMPKGFFTGWVDDLQLYDQALTDAQVDQLFRNPGLNVPDLEQPVLIRPNGGNFVSLAEVTLQSTLPGTAIRYTLDGSEPSLSSPLYAGPLTLRETTTVKARLFVNEFPVSAVISANFTQVPPISFEPPGGLFTNEVSVALVNNLGLGTILYTLDGTDPTAASTPYAGRVLLTSASTVKTRVFVNGFPASEIVSASFDRVYAVDDGIPNDWRERRFGPGYLTDPRVVAGADPDGDGWSNLLEYQSDTNPLDAASAPAIVSAIRAIPLVSWNSIPGLTYRVLRKSSVNQTDWDVVRPALQATETTSQFIDVGAPATAFYRIELVPQS